MTKRLEEVVADDEQDRVAEALLTFLREWQGRYVAGGVTK
jgi:hypothetical protein